MVSTPKSDAARLMAADAARRATLSPPSPQPPPSPPSTAPIDASRDVVALDESITQRARRVVVGELSRSLPPPPLPPPAPPAAVSSALTSTELPAHEKGPFRISGRDDLVVGAAEAARLEDPATRASTAWDIGMRVAQHEQVQAAFGGPEPFAAAAGMFSTLSAAERAALLPGAPSTTDLQAAVLAQPQGGARIDFIDAMRARAGLVGGASVVDEGSIAMRAGEIADDLGQQALGDRLTDEERAAAWNRVNASITIVGSAGEMIGGGIAALTPSVVGQAAGTFAIVHGADGVQAGVRQLLGEAPVDTFTNQLVTAGGVALGLDPAVASMGGTVVDNLASFIGGAPRVAARLGLSTPAKAAGVVDDVAGVARPLGVVDDLPPGPRVLGTAVDSPVQQRLARLDAAIDDPLGMSRITDNVIDAGAVDPTQARIVSSWDGLTSAEYARVRGHQATIEKVDAVVAANVDVLRELPEDLRDALFAGEKGVVRTMLPGVDDVGGALKESRGVITNVKEATPTTPARSRDHITELAEKSTALLGTKKHPGFIANAYAEAARWPLNDVQRRVVGEYLEAVRAVAVSGTPPVRHGSFAVVRAEEIARVNVERAALGLPPIAR